MSKPQKNKSKQLRELVFDQQAAAARLNEIADNCERESRPLDEQERVERDTIMREMELRSMKIKAITAEDLPEAPAAISREQVLRDNMAGKVHTQFVFSRDIQTSAALAGTGIIPVEEQEMLKPLTAGLIYEKLGLSVCSGLAAGQLRWPKHTRATAQFADEGEELVDANIDWDKLETTPVRLGIAIPVTREELESSGGVVESVIRTEIPAAAARKINAALLSLSTTYTDKEGKEKAKKIVGPFARSKRIEFAGAEPTRGELLKMKSTVSKSGIMLEAPCWIMTEDMKATLENIKVDEGSGRFLCENDRVLGMPVYCSPEIGEGNIGFGDWSYQAFGFFGQNNITVDPYTLLRRNATDFVFNAHVGTATLYQEAFVLGQAKAKAKAKA